MDREAQISLFILMGVVLLIIVGFFIYLNSTKEERIEKHIEKAQEIPTSMLPIKNYVDECLKEVTVPGIYLLAAQGGYIYNYYKVLNTDRQQVAYHLEYNTNVSPKVAFMENELSRYIEDTLLQCINYFESFPQYEFRFGDIKVESEIGEENIIVTVNYPITVISGDTETVISRFTSEFPVRLGHILDIKDQILLNLQNTGMIGFSLLTSFDIEVNVLPYDIETLLYSIYDEQSIIDNIPFFFNFAIKMYGNSAPRLEFIPDFTLTRGRTFEYKLEAYDQDEDEVLRFYTENALIDMNEETGEFSFTPLVTGEYMIEVCVQDRYLAEDCETMHFTIENE